MAEKSFLEKLGDYFADKPILAHVIIAVVMMHVAAGWFMLGTWAAGCPLTVGQGLALGSVGTGFYAYSREKTEFEFELREKAGLRTLNPFWYRGFWPLEWDGASQAQFIVPTLVVTAWATLVLGLQVLG